MTAATETIQNWQLVSLSRTDGIGNPLADVIASISFFLVMRWAEYQDRQEEAFADFEEFEFTPKIPRELGWRRLCDIFDNQSRYESEVSRMFERQTLADSILPALCEISGSHLAETIAQAAHSFDPRKLSWSLLQKTFDYSKTLAIETPAERQSSARAFDELVTEAVSQTRYGGESFTPSLVAGLMVEIANPQVGESVYDPCFGLGGLLAAAGERILKDAQNFSTGGWTNVVGNTLHGVEIAQTPFLIGLTRMILAGFNRPRLKLGNALEQDFHNPQQFDVVLAAPPLGGKIKDSWHYRQFLIRARSAENLFLQHIMASLKPNGRAIVAVPEGILFRGGADEKLRERLMSDFAVEAVVALPEGSMLPYTSVKANLLVFRRAAPASSVWFQEAETTSKAKAKTPATFDAAREAQIFRAKETPSLHAWTQSAQQIAERDFELIVKRRSNRLESFFDELRRHEPDLETVKLGEIAEVISGVGYTRRDVFPKDEIASERATPLVRVTELGKDGRIKPAALFFSENAINRVSRSNKRLFAGDLIISTQGTIGKVGRVDEFYDGAIPAHGITTVRLKTDKIQPLYLLRLLQSQPVQEWLKSQAYGTTIKNVSLREIENLPVPVLKANDQKTLADSLSPNAYAREILQLLSEDRSGQENPFIKFASEFLNQSYVKDLIAQGFDKDDAKPQIEKLFFDLSEKFYARIDEVGRDKMFDDSLIGQTFLFLFPFTSKITQAFEIPYCADRFAIVELCKNEAGQIIKELSAVSADENLKNILLALVGNISAMLESENEKILAQANVTATIETPILDADNAKHITVRIRNESKMPLCAFGVFNSVHNERLNFHILGSDTEMSVAISLPEQAPGEYPLTIAWDAMRIDNVSVEGKIDLSYRIREKQAAESLDLGENPYVIGTSIDSASNQEMFFGRADVIDQIRRSSRLTGSSTVLLLEGNRRIGKSSILKHLLLPDVLPDWIPVYFNTQGGDGSQTEVGLSAKEIFYGITREIILALHSKGIEFEAVILGRILPALSRRNLREMLRTKLRAAFENDAPFELLDMQIESVAEALGKRRIILLLDEFDKIDEGIQSGVTNPIVPENIRNLFHAHNHISGVLTGARRIKHLRENHWSALYGIGVSITVDALDVESARKLVTAPVENRLLYAASARDKVIELCARMPFLIQSLCYRIFEYCYEKGEQNVTLSTVEAAAEKMVEDNENFQTLFDFIGNYRRRYVACAVNLLSKNPDRVTFDAIEERLNQDEIEYATKDLADDIKHLQELDVLEFENDSYKIKIPLFAKWLEINDEQMFRRQAVEE